MRVFDEYDTNVPSLKSILSALTSRPNAFNLSPGDRVELRGGLRCRTLAQTFSCELVIKVGSYAELVRQQDYVHRLPGELPLLFPRVFVLQESGVQGEGVMIMEKLDGRSLHEILWDIATPKAEKLAATRCVLDKLADLHCFPIQNSVVERDPSVWLEKLRARLDPIAAEVPSYGKIVSRIDSLKIGVPRSSRRACLLHGDAQAGNFIVSSSSGVPVVKFIDPLGGSGSRTGDPVYDLSRFSHWIRVAGACYELENAAGDSFSQRKRSFGQVQTEVERLVQHHLLEVAPLSLDPVAVGWFHLYGAYHLSGKLHDFRSKLSRRVLSRELTRCLARASQNLVPKDYREVSHAVH